MAVGFSVIFFGLVLGLAWKVAGDPRWGESPASLEEFAEGNVSVGTGVIAGREAMIQVLMLPVALAFAATAIAVVFWAVS